MSVQTSGIMELISKLRKEGILEIENERNKIIKIAQDNAEKIIKTAEKTSTDILDKCDQECLRKKKNLDSELKIVIRDFLLIFSKNIKTQLIHPIIEKKLSDVINDTNFLKDTLKNILVNILEKDTSNLLILLNVDKKNDLIEFFSHAMFKDMLSSNKISFGFTDKFQGFQIIKKDDKLIWDFTLTSLTQEIGKLVEPHLLRYFI
jgi:vacuolar-type H+-ATPase subunit E/Vma4